MATAGQKGASWWLSPPKQYYPHLLEEWPVDGDLVVPLEDLPENLNESMGNTWRLKQKNQQILDEQDNQ